MGFCLIRFPVSQCSKAPPRATPSTNTHRQTIICIISTSNFCFYTVAVTSVILKKYSHPLQLLSLQKKRGEKKTIILSSAVCLWHLCELAVLFAIRMNALQDTHKGKAKVLKGEHCLGVRHLSPPLWGWRNHALNVE